MTRPFLSRPSVPAVLIGSAAFAGLYWLSSFGLFTLLNWWFYPAIPEDAFRKFASSWLWQVFAWALYLVPGFLAGLIARRSGLMHGALVGALTAPIMALLIHALGFWSAVEYSSMLYGLILGLVWCSLAGLVGELAASKVWPR